MVPGAALEGVCVAVSTLCTKRSAPPGAACSRQFKLGTEDGVFPKGNPNKWFCPARLALRLNGHLAATARGAAGAPEGAGTSTAPGLPPSISPCNVECCPLPEPLLQ